MVTAAAPGSLHRRLLRLRGICPPVVLAAGLRDVPVVIIWICHNDLPFHSIVSFYASDYGSSIPPACDGPVKRNFIFCKGNLKRMRHSTQIGHKSTRGDRFLSLRVSLCRGECAVIIPMERRIFTQYDGSRLRRGIDSLKRGRPGKSWTEACASFKADDFQRDNRKV